MLEFLRPNKIYQIFEKYSSFLTIITGLLWVLGLYLAFIGSPPDYIQGDIVRIMYVHVPASWMALAVYAFMALLSLIFLVWRVPMAGFVALASAPIGLTFSAISLATGALWGKPMWGAWWVWDARLTSMLILFFLYVGYVVLVNAFHKSERGLKAVSLFTIVGALDLPIIKWSVVWWNTLHQPPSVMKFSAPTIHLSMLLPLGVMFLAFFSYFILILNYRIRAEIEKRKYLIKMRVI